MGIPTGEFQGYKLMQFKFIYIFFATERGGSPKPSEPSLLTPLESTYINDKWACAYYAGIILRIIGHQFCENNSEIIGWLQA